VRRLRVLTSAAAGAALSLVLAPATASAHGISGKTDLPIPQWMFAWAAAIVLVVSFVGLAVLWPRPRLQTERLTRRLRFPRVLEPLCGLLGVVVFALVVYAGIAGEQNAFANVVPTFVYVVFWVGLVFLSLVFGDVFRAFNPWRATARGVAWVAGRAAPDGLPAPLAYPERLGRWPAAVGIVAFGWVELVLTDRDDPRLLAVLMLVYAATQLVGMSVYGVESWTRNADPFAVYFATFARLSPLTVKERVLYSRPLLSGAPQLDVGAGTVALLCAMIGTTMFDGLSQGTLWTNVAPTLQDGFKGVGLAPDPALEGAFTVGLLFCVLFVGGLYRLGIAGMATIGEDHRAPELRRAFAHTLIPIAAAYVVAHYFSLLVFQGQAMFYLVSDPLGQGSDLLGTADTVIDYGVVSPTAVWYVQVVALIAGHVAGLVLAHDRALSVYRSARRATRSQYWMLAVMVGFTGLGLWLLSAAGE
jgi:hypothetical protein